MHHYAEIRRILICIFQLPPNFYITFKKVSASTLWFEFLRLITIPSKIWRCNDIWVLKLFFVGWNFVVERDFQRPVQRIFQEPVGKGGLDLGSYLPDKTQNVRESPRCFDLDLEHHPVPRIQAAHKGTNNIEHASPRTVRAIRYTHNIIYFFSQIYTERANCGARVQMPFIVYVCSRSQVGERRGRSVFTPPWSTLSVHTSLHNCLCWPLAAQCVHRGVKLSRSSIFFYSHEMQQLCARSVRVVISARTMMGN